MQCRFRRQTQTPNVPRVRRNLRLDQNNIKQESLRNAGKQEIAKPKFFSCVPAFLRDQLILPATTFSSLTISAANLRMPSESFSVPSAFSFKSQRNLFSSSSSLSILALFAFSGSSLRSVGSVV